MLQRCYDPKLHLRHPTYKECNVIEEWHNFQNFASWFEKNYIDGYQIDKDLLVEGNKIYSPETCCFVPKEINLILGKPIKKGKYPVGVSKFRNKFVTHVHIKNKQHHMGMFDTIEDAFLVYKIIKERNIKHLAETYKHTINESLYKILINYSVNINT